MKKLLIVLAWATIVLAAAAYYFRYQPVEHNRFFSIVANRLSGQMFAVYGNKAHIVTWEKASESKASSFDPATAHLENSTWLELLRSAYPAYNNMANKKLLNAIYKKCYQKVMSKDEFKKIANSPLLSLPLPTPVRPCPIVQSGSGKEEGGNSEQDLRENSGAKPGIKKPHHI